MNSGEKNQSFKLINFFSTIFGENLTVDHNVAPPNGSTGHVSRGTMLKGQVIKNSTYDM